jgi:hypothetical protein
MLPYRFTGKELDEETGLYYYGARYLDPRVSRWLSADPALGEYIPSAPVNDEARKRNGNLPGMGGVFNYVNLHAYHYAGNNPVRYIDPDGKMIRDEQGKLKTSMIGTLSIGKWETNYEIHILYTDNANPVIGLKLKSRTGQKRDNAGDMFGDGEFILQPGFMRNSDYNAISKKIDSDMSRTGNLETLLNDECTLVGKEDAKSGDLLVRRDPDGKSILHGIVVDFKKGFFRNSYTLRLDDGSVTSYTGKDFNNNFDIYRKNKADE